MRRIVYPIDNSKHQETFAWTRELTELTNYNLTVVTEERESETEKALSNQQISRLLIYYYQHCYHPVIKGDSAIPGTESDISIIEQALKFPEIIFTGARFKELIHYLHVKEDLLVLHPQTFKHNPHLASIVDAKIPVIILPDKIDFSKLRNTSTGKNCQEEKARLFYKTLRRATKHKLPKDLYEKLGRDTRIFNMIAAYFRKNFNQMSDPSAYPTSK